MRQRVDQIKSWAEFFVDLGGRKDVASIGGKHYPMIVKVDSLDVDGCIVLGISQTLRVLLGVFLLVCVLTGSRRWLRLLDLTTEVSFSVGNLNPCAMNF